MAFELLMKRYGIHITFYNDNLTILISAKAYKKYTLVVLIHKNSNLHEVAEKNKWNWIY